MRKLTMALLGAASICLAITIAYLLWRVAGGWAAGAAGLASGLGLALSLQGVVDRSLDQKRLLRDFEALARAHLAVTARLEEINASLAVLAEAVQEKAVRRSEELTFEVRMLEDLVHRMHASLDERLAAGVQGLGRAEARRDAVPHPARAGVLLETVRQALAENRVDLYLQPVVALPQRRTLFYESFSRLRDATGQVLMPAQYLSVAEPGGLISAIDNLLLFRCVQIVGRLAKQERKVAIFCNISLASLRDEAFFGQFLSFLSENAEMAGALIFELGLGAFEQRGALEARHMARLGDLGFRFSIDKVDRLDLDFRELQRSDVKFVKIAAEALIGQPESAGLAALARRHGVEVVAEKIETERQAACALELEIGLGQGHLFGEPRAIRDSVLAETDPPPGFMQSTLRRAAAR